MSTPRAGLSLSVSEILAFAVDGLPDTNWASHSHTAISTVGFGEITPRSFFGRQFSIVWNEMANGHTPRMSYAQTRHAFAQSEVVRSPLLPFPLFLVWL